MAFTENGKKLYEAFMDKEIEQIAWENMDLELVSPEVHTMYPN